MPVDAKGPIFAAGTEVITQDGYAILFLPDVNNDFLQREGKPPVYHWLPNAVRLAQKPNGDYKFNMIHFVGVRSGSTHVGVSGTDEVAGGLAGFSTTSSVPPQVLQQAEQQLIDRFRGSDQNYWGWRVPATPMFRPAPIVSNTTTITNLGPTAGGAVPGVPALPPGGTRSALAAPPVRALRYPIVKASPRTVPLARGYRDSNLDPWFVNLQGQGPGSITPFAENAYSGLLGSYPAALVWASFHGGQTPIAVWQNMRIKVWAPVVEITMTGHWGRVQDHFSAAAHGGGWFWSADIKAEFNSLRASGGIDVTISVDPTIPGAEKIQESVDKRTDLVFQKFMEEAQKFIFEPPAFTEKPAEASGGFLGLGGGVAVKLRRDRRDLDLYYHEKREMAYLQEYPISSTLEGLYDVIKADPSAEKKYFITLYLDDWDRKVARNVKPVVNWPDPTRKWVGEPVNFLSVQVGYPDTQGAIQWDGHVFDQTAGPNAVWHTAMAMKKQTDVANPPPGWAPDKTYLKRKIHFSEPPSASENPFVRVSVEQNEVELDPGPSGILVDDLNLEVRVDNAGALNVGPIFLGIDLEGPKQIVEVTFQAAGRTTDGHDRPEVKFSWSESDQTEPRFWMIYTGQPDFVPNYKYQVRVIVKGGILTHGMEWIGPWVETGGNGPLMVRVPTPEDTGVNVVSRTMIPTSATIAVGRPPGTGAQPGVAAAGQPPTRTPPPGSRDVTLAADTYTGRAPADDPFAVTGYQPRDVSANTTRGITGPEDSGGWTVRDVRAAGQPPMSTGSTPAGPPPTTTTRNVTGQTVVGGRVVEEDKPSH